MPTYEYRCSACGHTFEKFQSITAEPIRQCPECGKKKVNRLIGTGAGIIFKGSGFYITDYRSDGYKSAAKSESSSASKPTESKPAATPAAASTGASTPAASTSSGKKKAG